jgi:phosphomannomutase/phosphoglucomutase
VSTNLPPNIFKAYDIRGIVGKEITVELYFQIGQALGSMARAVDQHHFFSGRDGRLSSPKLHTALIDGLLASGCDVTDIGCIPTPVGGFAATQLGTGNMAVVTASHNPSNYNGLKMMVAGNSLSSAQIQEIRQRIEQQNFCTGKGNLNQQDVVSDYIDYICQRIRLNRPLKVVVDCGNGAAGVTAAPLLRKLGCEVIELYCEVDGHFPNHHPDPSQPGNMAMLIAKVSEHQADVGFGFDGDGDRLGVISPDGHFIWPDLQMILFAEDILKREPEASIIFDVKSTNHLARRIEQAEGQPIMWMSGYTYIKAKMKEINAKMAGEMSGHIYFNDDWYGVDDACYSAARMLSILANDDRTPQEIFDTLPQPYTTPELHLMMDEGEPFKVMERLRKIAKFEDAAVIDIDGIRVEFAEGWGLVRASNTTPSLVFRFEADCPRALKRIQAQFRDLLLAADPSLVMPY